jgi:hypothetical protein
MPSAEYDATPREVRNFALLQLALTSGFLVLLFFMLGGTDADYPPIWLSIVLVALVALGAFLAERVWLSTTPLPPDAEQPNEVAVGVFAAQTVRKLAFCEAPLIAAVLVAFVADHGGWPVLIAGMPGIAVLAWETWPSLRNAAMTASMLDAEGAESRLVESFLEP